MPEPKLVKIGEVAKHYGISTQCVRSWEKEGKIVSIRTKKGTRMFDLSKIIKVDPDEEPRKKYFYCRVSNISQRDDLKRQVQLAEKEYPGSDIVTDIGSGLNWKRKGLKRILAQSSRGEVEEIVIFHKDRLCRFGFEILEYILELQQTRLVVHEPDVSKTESEELAEDLMAITHVFSCSYYGKRRYKSKEDKVLSDSETGEDS